jgi:hypothetical protein
MGRCVKLRVHLSSKSFVLNSPSAIHFALVVHEMIHLNTIAKVFPFLNKTMMEVERPIITASGTSLASMGKPTGNIGLRK